MQVCIVLLLLKICYYYPIAYISTIISTKILLFDLKGIKKIDQIVYQHGPCKPHNNNTVIPSMAHVTNQYELLCMYMLSVRRQVETLQGRYNMINNEKGAYKQWTKLLE